MAQKSAKGQPAKAGLVNWRSPYNQGLVGWWLGLPRSGWWGGEYFRDLVGYAGRPTLYSMQATDGAGGTSAPWYNSPSCRGFKSVSLDGVNDTLYTQAAAFPYYPEFSFSCWFIRGATNSGSFGSIACHHTANGSPSDWYLYLDLSTNKLKVDIPWVAGAVVTGATSITSTADWNHVTVTRSGSAGSWTYTLYLNGVQDGQATTSSNPNGTAENIWIGSLSSLSNFSNTAVSDCRYFSRAVGAAEAYSQYAVANGGHGDTLNPDPGPAWVPDAAGSTPGLRYACGSLTWASADAATTAYTVSGLGFQPKALRFTWNGASVPNAVDGALDGRRGVGFATSASSRYCVSGFDNDAAATSACGSCWSDDCVAITHNKATVTGKLDLFAITSDGFTLVVDDAVPADLAVVWEAWGGDALTNVAAGQIDEPVATGTQDTTAGFQPDAVMFAGCQSSEAANTPAASGSGLAVGFATGTASTAQCVQAGNAQDGQATTSSTGYGRAGECVAMIAATAGARASLSAFLPTGFTLNWAARAVTGRKNIYLAAKGGRWKAGGNTIDNQVGGNTSAVTGLPFAPVGISVIDGFTAENAAGTTNANDRVSTGAAMSTATTRVLGYLSRDAQADAAVCVTYANTLARVIAHPNNVGTDFVVTINLQSLNPDGFTLQVGAAGTNAAEWYGYLAFGSEATLVEEDRPAVAQYVENRIVMVYS